MVHRIEHRTHKIKRHQTFSICHSWEFFEAVDMVVIQVFSQFYLLRRRKRTSTNSDKLIAVLSGRPFISELDFRPSPRCFSEELQAGCNAGVMSETANGDLAPHFLPAGVLDQPLQHHGQSDSV